MVGGLGSGKTIGLAILALRFNFGLYVLINEQGKTVADAWDGVTLKFSFRRSVSPSLMNMWYEILAIAGSIVFSTDPDAIVWKFTSNGIYSVQSLYAVVNFRGVKPIHPQLSGSCAFLLEFRFFCGCSAITNSSLVIIWRKGGK